MVYVFYLAVAKGKRGQGYGGKILGLLKKHFEGKALFLAREQLDDKAENIGRGLTGVISILLTDLRTCPIESERRPLYMI